MVATDTVVGIVGAVLLVAVMAGVFAYEYNNPVEGDGGAGDLAEQKAHFEADYVGLAADQDIDGDGIPNYNDTDIDGDGTPNENDTAVSYHQEMSGALGPQAGNSVKPTVDMPFPVGNGTVHIVVKVDTTTAVPIYGGNFLVELLKPDGSLAAGKASPTTGGSSITVETPQDYEFPAGTWTVRVSQNQAGVGGNVSIAADVHYGVEMAHEHDH